MPLWSSISLSNWKNFTFWLSLIIISKSLFLYMLLSIRNKTKWYTFVYVFVNCYFFREKFEMNRFFVIICFRYNFWSGCINFMIYGNNYPTAIGKSNVLWFIDINLKIIANIYTSALEHVYPCHFLPCPFTKWDNISRWIPSFWVILISRCCIIIYIKNK